MYGIFLLVATVAMTVTEAKAACMNPAGTEGSDPIYNTSTKQLQYCDGTDWVAMHPPPAASGPTGCTNIGDLCDDSVCAAGLV